MPIAKAYFAYGSFQIHYFAILQITVFASDCYYNLQNIDKSVVTISITISVVIRLHPLIILPQSP